MMRVAILVCAMAASALAAPDDRETSTEAGTAYLERYNAAPDRPDGDELLYNAAVAFEAGRSIGRAIEIFARLEQQYPRSKLAARALARLGKLYGTIAFYDKAAEKLEEYAKKYAGEKDAYDAISDAVYYRKALGDRAKAIEDTKYFVKTYGAKQPRAAADAMWSLTALYEADPDQVVAHLREYLHAYGSKGGAERVVIAYAKIGQVLWKESCPVPGVDGLCVKANDRAARTCGTGTTRTLVRITRDERRSKEAVAAFASAISEYERVRTDDPAARYYYAQARLAAADGELEPYLGLAFPRDLDFDRGHGATRLASEKRFREWIEQKQRAGGSASRKYEAVLAVKDAASSIAAAARIGIVAQSFASTLVTGEIPRDTRTAADRVKVYCEMLEDVAAPLETMAVSAFGVCLAKSTELGWFSDASVQCERELIRMKPAEFPRAIELRSQPVMVAPVIALEPASP